MSKVVKKNILVLVEGAKTDVKVMEKLFNIYEIDAKYKIVSYCTNIYTLYQEMFRDGIDGLEDMDILQVLKAREKNIEKKKIFDKRYTDILLIFDLDPQDPQFVPENIKLMQDYFCESSDMGKLYLNYPMIEAFYHLSSIPDDEYFSRKVKLKELQDKKYKFRVQQESMGNDYRKFAASKDLCNIIILQNLTKAIFLATGKSIKWKDVVINANLIELIDSNFILEKQLFHLKNDKFIYVLCTCVFYIIEYNPNLLLS
ncbi:hypothetical protein [Clostridium autoethanogenum]|uniref:DUF4435 domain-containing protein n=1 Tax=Clostridium autoethanogenum DSM 10061 TaxID=1341692 RepID=A0ABM5NYK2_9CLOT|nr:hypothetical protein [Clostridium autoethanogenum]AGY77725.2 hypothetical protein CAETHG_3522 [Clostridium autoethanogenum DSM 10061]